MIKDIWFKWYPARYKSDTMHLTAEQDGIYRRLIDFYMETEKPLPSSIVALARIAGVSQLELESSWPALCSFFVDSGDTLRLKLCDEQISERTQKSERFKEFGKLGGRPKVSDKKPDDNPEVKGGDSLSKADKNRGDISSLHSDIPPIDPPAEKQPDGSEGLNQPENDTVFRKPEAADSPKAPEGDTVAKKQPDAPEAPKIEKPKGKRNDTGTLLTEWLQLNGPANGTLPQDWILWVDGKYGWNDETIAHIAGRFYRYFTGPDAKNPRKKDWKRAFQNWCDGDINAAKSFISANQGGNQGQGGGYSGAVSDSSEKARSIIEAGNSGGSGSGDEDGDDGGYPDA